MEWSGWRRGCQFVDCVEVDLHRKWLGVMECHCVPIGVVL